MNRTKVYLLERTELESQFFRVLKRTNLMTRSTRYLGLMRPCPSEDNGIFAGEGTVEGQVLWCIEKDKSDDNKDNRYLGLLRSCPSEVSFLYLGALGSINLSSIIII